jgi:2-oxoglutarate dehydrogenase E2 component (dihydrolipoamide succinyltransferase)
MAIELKIPATGESITEVEIGQWLKKPGDWVKEDEPLVSIESEKATVELPAPASGTVTQVLKKTGEPAGVGEVIAYIEPSSAPAPKGRAGDGAPAAAKEPSQSSPRIMPAAQRALAEQHLRPEEVHASGPGGRLLKEDVLREVKDREAKQVALPSERAVPPGDDRVSGAAAEVELGAPTAGLAREEEVIPMTRLRRTVAERLVEAQNTMALLTTFNDVDMTAVLALRKQYGEAFQKKNQVKLGLMSFFVKASIEALKMFPQVNAEIRGTGIVYHNYYDIGVAIGAGKGLVVPVLRGAERMSFAEIERAIADFARRAQENKLKVDELQGGTFTISNGGVYGSMLSTPIVNPPQSGILGMHAIQERPVAREGAVVIRPMMYLALTYDHRLVDGREAVGFLKKIKEAIENPASILLEV